MTAAALHEPVMLNEVLNALAISPGERHVDGTYGAGGYSRAMLAAGAQVLAFDRDPDAIALGRADPRDRLTLFHAPFSRMAELLAEAGLLPVDGVALDIGVSSMQLDRPERGFSAMQDGPLDARMEQAGETAGDFLNRADEAEIADVIHRYGEEPRARRIARAIVAARPLARTTELAAVVRRACGWHPGMAKDPAFRVFQAIRIHINRELEELENGLKAAEAALRPGGRLAVVTFHSLEDRIVKRFFRERSGGTGGSRHRPANDAGQPQPSFGQIAKKLKACPAEVQRNPRARSAVLRAGVRTAAPAWGREGGSVQ